ncbi:MAG: glycoside hydrolase family 43 protein [Planctomycetota bacterium]
MISPNPAPITLDTPDGRNNGLHMRQGSGSRAVVVCNPVIPGFYPDPSICRVDDDYYLATSSFEYFPGVPIFHSRDLVHWRQLGHALDRPSQLPLEDSGTSGGIYAPTLRYHQGRFYMITTNVSYHGSPSGGNFLVHTTDPSGPWSEPIWIDQEGIDPDIFFDHDGTVYITSSGRSDGRCRIVQSTFTLDLERGVAERNEPVVDLWDGTGGRGPEAPHLYHIDGVYYLMIAEGGTEDGHMVTIARGPSPRGPWDVCPRNPILSNRSLDRPLQATGHGDLVQSPDGSWWMVLLATRPTGYHRVHVLGRETCLAPVRWDAEGWPVVGKQGELPHEATWRLPHPLHRWPKDEARDDFDMDHLGHHWNHLYNPSRSDYCLSQRPGWLTLHARSESLATDSRPTWIGQRQTAFDQVITALLDFEPRQEGDEAGLVAWQNHEHHYEIARTLRAGRTVLIVRRQIGSLSGVVAQVEEDDPSSPVQLRVSTSKTHYRFAYSHDGNAWTEIASGESRYLSSEVGGLFTGVYFALYSLSGSKEPPPARFDWFQAT